MKLVIAGNYKQYRYYLKVYNQTPKEMKYVTCEEHILGYHNPETILFGEYWKNPVYKHLYHQLALVQACIK